MKSFVITDRGIAYLERVYTGEETGKTLSDMYLRVVSNGDLEYEDEEDLTIKFGWAGKRAIKQLFEAGYIEEE